MVTIDDLAVFTADDKPIIIFYSKHTYVLTFGIVVNKQRFFDHGVELIDDRVIGRGKWEIQAYGAHLSSRRTK